MEIYIVGATAPCRSKLIKTVDQIFPTAQIHLTENIPHHVEASLIVISSQSFSLLNKSKSFTAFLRLPNPPRFFVFNCPNQETLASALSQGAIDGVCSPFHQFIFNFRLKKLLLNAEGLLQPIKSKYFYLDPNTFQLRTSTIALQMRLKDFSLLKFLISHPNILVTRNQLLTFVWAERNEVMSNTIDCHINTIRKQLKKLDLPVEIQTIYGKGYVYKEKN